MRGLLRSAWAPWALLAAAAAFPFLAQAIGQPYLVRVAGVVGLFMLLGLGIGALYAMMGAAMVTAHKGAGVIHFGLPAMARGAGASARGPG